MNTQPKPEEVEHLSVAEYNRFCEWWEPEEVEHLSINESFVVGGIRAVALAAYIHALEPIEYSARLS